MITSVIRDKGKKEEVRTNSVTIAVKAVPQVIQKNNLAGIILAV